MARPRSTPEELLARLVRQQARDAGRWRVPPDEGCFAFSQLGTPDRPLDPDRLPDRRAPEPAEVLTVVDEAVEVEAESNGKGHADLDRLRDARRRACALHGLCLHGLSEVWSSAIIRYDGSTPCPVCHGRLDRRDACLVCSASGEDKQRHPMAGSLSPDAQRLSRKGRDGRKLAGGLGDRPKPAKKRGRPRRANPWRDWQPAGW